ncbi:putative response regulatory protein [compost metagenome]
MLGKLLIVEDQVFFRKGLRKMIEDHELGWTVVGEAENGREALEQMGDLQPNLVLTDIRMPEMDGIELARHVHEQWSDVSMIILTGYEDFKYAQAALRYGAIDFLLKPCNEKVLIDVLQKAYQLFLQSQHRKELHLAAKQVEEEAALRSLLLKLPISNHVVANVQKYVIDRELILIHISNYYPQSKQYREKDLGLLQFAIFNMIHELMTDFGYSGKLVTLEYNRFSLLLESNNRFQEFKKAVSDAVAGYLGITAIIEACGFMNSPLELTEAYERFVASFPTSLGQPIKSDILHEFGNGAEYQARIKELQGGMTANIVMGRMEQWEDQLQAWTQHMQELDPITAKMEALILSIAMNNTAKRQLDVNEEWGLNGTELELLQQSQTHEQMITWIQEQAHKFARAFELWKSNKNDNLIDRVREYLDKHYMETCSLADIAEMFHISSTYFSKLFKKDTGDNFSQYLTKLRMNKAMMLLAHTDMKIFEVAAAVGYDDPNYFTNVFRMILHISPSDFRKQSK